jgi:sigma-B regulation protein RsbU (phosphoserine phosphatase)
MKFRWKLLMLLLALSILPIVGLRAFGIHNVHLMADALTAHIEKLQMDDAQEIRQTIEDRVRTVEQVTAGFLVLLVALNAVLALMFSRSITRPLELLTTASNKLAKGNFKARVDIRSRDEFGDLGRVFNQVGPQLDTHVRLQQAMDAAMQLQYNLLPQAAPNLSGLDVRGMAFYCDETGGDYFDYLCVDKEGRQRLCMVPPKNSVVN